jgi:hypothetical protein
MGLSLRVGPLGDLMTLRATVPKGGQQPVIEFFHGVRNRGLTAFGVETSRLPARGIAAAFAADAAKYGVETHALGFGNHPLDIPYFHAGRLRPHAACHVLVQEFLLANQAGMASYTLTGPRKDLAGPEAVIEDCTSILDYPEARAAGCRLRLSNGPTPQHPFPTVLEARDAATGVPGLGLTYHLGAEFFVSRKDLFVDDYRSTLRELPADTLFVYGNCRIDEHGLGWADYHAAGAAHPDPMPFLWALKESGRGAATVLVHGIKPELDALEILTVAHQQTGS